MIEVRPAKLAELRSAWNDLLIRAAKDLATARNEGNGPDLAAEAIVVMLQPEGRMLRLSNAINAVLEEEGD